MPSDGRPGVRVAGLADAADLARLRYRWRAGDRGEQGPDQHSFEVSFCTWMEHHRFTHVPFLAFREHEPIGMAWLALVDRVPGPQHFSRRSAYIQSAYVVAHERCGGVGTMLMELVLDHTRDLGLDYVAVHPSQASFSFYRRLGFEGTDRVLERRA